MNRQTYFSLLILFSIAPTNSLLAETPAAPAKFKETYPQEFAQSYLQECRQTSLEEGLAEVEAKNLCGCTLNKFQQQYTLQEFKQLTAAAAQDTTAENTLVEVGQGCLEEILYEQ
jgi:uncharacterized membrane protein